MKRRGPSQSGGSAKIQRRESYQGDDASNRPWAVKAGMIYEIILTNFMCHEKFKFVPNQRMNFLCGENGSGKSAILTAVVFGLGGTAKMTNRGTSNKGFIRAGQKSASVEIKMCNSGSQQYRSDRYGDSITVMRTVTQSSSSYKLKDQDGRIVSVSKPKEEIDRILTQFNIQVENPVVVLNQDTSKTFLAKADPEKLYQFFSRSTQLQDCEYHYNEAKKNRDIAEENFEKKNSSMSELKKEVGGWKKKWDFLEQMTEKNNEINQKSAELAWALTRDADLEVDRKDGKVKLIEEKISAADSHIKKASDKDKQQRLEKKAIEKEIQEKAATFEIENVKMKEKKKIYDEMILKSKQASRNVEQLKRNIEKKQKMMKEVGDEIVKYKNGKCREYEEKRLARANQRKKVSEEMDSLNAQIETSGNHLTHLNADKRSKEDAAQNAKWEANSLKVKIQQRKKDIYRLESGEKNKLAAFGEFMPRLVNEIQKSKKFNKKPIGPFGAFISLKENLPEEINAVLEGELGSMMMAFCCDSSKDQAVLYDMCKRLNISKVTIMTSEFSSQRHDVSNTKVCSSSYTTLLDCMEISDPTVFNILVDTLHLEKIIAIPSAAEAQKILKNPETVPKNLKYAVVEAKYQYYPAPNYKSYYKGYRSQNMLMASFDDLIAGMKKEVVNYEKEAVVAQEKYLDLVNQANSSLKLLDTEEKKIVAIRKKLTEKNLLSQTLDNEEYAEKPADIAALEEDREKFEEELSGLEVKLREAQDLRANQRQAEQTAKAEHDLLKGENDAQSVTFTELTNRLTDCEKGICVNKHDIDHYNTKKVEYSKNINEANKAKEESVAHAKHLYERALRWKGDKIETQRNADELSRELTLLKASVSKQQDIVVEDKATVKEKFEAISLKFKTAKSDLRSLEVMLKKLETSIRTRKTGFKLFLRVTSQHVERNFTAQLTSRNFSGNLRFHHQTRMLDIVVNPAVQNEDDHQAPERDLRSLSGGERSFTLVCFILSLWDVMHSPFRILDEFDVFMDACNRRISIANMINYAKEDRKNQFVFLTPLDTNNIDVNDDLKIIKLVKHTN